MDIFLGHQPEATGVSHGIDTLSSNKGDKLKKKYEKEGWHQLCFFDGGTFYFVSLEILCDANVHPIVYSDYKYSIKFIEVSFTFNNGPHDIYSHRQCILFRVRIHAYIFFLWSDSNVHFIDFKKRDCKIRRG